MTETFGGDPLDRAGTQPVFFDDPAMDRMLAMLLALAEELAVTRERLDTHERLLQSHGLLKIREIEDYRPDAPAKADRKPATTGWSGVCCGSSTRKSVPRTTADLQALNSDSVPQPRHPGLPAGDTRYRDVSLPWISRTSGLLRPGTNLSWRRIC